ncbi:CsgE family curli-type amyloid fiber assembly protein [Litchfieldella xinjiangensis]|uniref:CsgE family curli-type amyloid fiber assembly protein n=1 Tax=Litchfieldella xinjiangensis TaxID=1166948 RepID=UPI0012E0A1E4|nr:CsgE family curli-type amyloid fiber assembly protein [Halomonas xinjiangensis]
MKRTMGTGVVSLCGAFLFSLSVSAEPLTPTSPDGETSNASGTEGINQLQGPDGPKVEAPVNGTSELTGVLVDRTMTIIGQRFYRRFSQIAMERPIIRGATLTVHERPDARWGVQLWITEGNQIHFRTRLSPRLNDADDVARQAIDHVEEAVLKRQIAKAMAPSIDLAEEEF